MKRVILALVLALSLIGTGRAAELGANVESLLDHARLNNPEYAAMRFEAEAATERVVPAGALPDPVLRTELQNITNYNAETGSSSFNLLPSRVGSTKYTLM